MSLLLTTKHWIARCLEQIVCTVEHAIVCVCGGHLCLVWLSRETPLLHRNAVITHRNRDVLSTCPVHHALAWILQESIAQSTAPTHNAMSQQRLTESHMTCGLADRLRVVSSSFLIAADAAAMRQQHYASGGVYFRLLKHIDASL